MSAAATRSTVATRSVGVGLSGAVIPAVGRPTVEVAPGTMEFGIGHHGEAGVRVVPLAPAREVAEAMVRAVLPELLVPRQGRVAVLLSGLGGTPVMEIYILVAAIKAHLDEQGPRVHRILAGTLSTSMGMLGATLTLTPLDSWLDAPARCAAVDWRAA